MHQDDDFRGHYTGIFDRIIGHPEYLALSSHARLAVLSLKIMLPSLGLGRVHPHELADALGVSPDETCAVLDELQRTGWVELEGRWLWLVNGLRYATDQRLTNKNNVKGLVRALMDVPNGLRLKDRLISHYPELGLRPSGAPSEPLRRPSGAPREALPIKESKIERESKREREETDTSKSKSVISTRVSPSDADELSQNDTPAPVAAAAAGTGEGTTPGTADRPGRAKDPGGESGTGAIVKRLYGIWLEEFGGNPPLPKLTPKRVDCLRLLWTEQLHARDGPEELFRQVCRAVKQSDHHMSQRAYQMPESLFRNPERRDRWVNIALNGSGLEGLGPGDRKILKTMRDLSTLDFGAAP